MNIVQILRKLTFSVQRSNDPAQMALALHGRYLGLFTTEEAWRMLFTTNLVDSCSDCATPFIKVDRTDKTCDTCHAEATLEWEVYSNKTLPGLPSHKLV